MKMGSYLPRGVRRMRFSKRVEPSGERCSTSYNSPLYDSSFVCINIFWLQISLLEKEKWVV
jgi:hypothetical protein